MIKVGQIYKDIEYGAGKIYTITFEEEDGGFDGIFSDGRTFQYVDKENIEKDELIAEYPTWQEAVNSSEFRGKSND